MPTRPVARWLTSGFLLRLTALAALILLAPSALTACSEPAKHDTDLQFDAGVLPDATTDAAADGSNADVGGSDAATQAADAAQGDSQSTDAGAADVSSGLSTAWGDITGACGAITAQLAASGPSFLVNTLKFNPAAAFSPSGLSVGAQQRYDGGNAGGSSVCSEVMSMQVLHECEGAQLYKTETQIIYTRSKGAITDYETIISGHKVGVSVTRAYKGPVIQTFTLEDAKTLLTKKLTGVVESTAKVSPGDKWTKQVLHVWTLRADWVPTLKAAWESMGPAIQSDTVVLVSVEVPPPGSTGWIVPDDCGAK